MEYKDYYSTLGVAKGADEKEIKKAYRKLAREFHPDVNKDNPSAEARFKEVNEAYAVLSDADKRAKYDRFGSQWERWAASSSLARDFCMARASARSSAANLAACLRAAVAPRRALNWGSRALWALWTVSNRAEFMGSVLCENGWAESRPRRDSRSLQSSLQ